MKTFGLALRQGLQKTIYPLVSTATIGRAPDNTIPVVHPTVSRKHARLSLEGSSWVIEDLGSRNGIVIEGRRIDKVKLRPGDTFQLGEIDFYFFDMDVPQGRSQFLETVEIILAAAEEESGPTGQPGADQRLEHIQDMIARIPFLSSLDESHCQQLMENAALHVFNAGELIVRQGDLGGSIYAVLEGKVKVFTKDHRDNDLELAVLGPSEFFGEMSFLSEKHRSRSVAALETTLLVEFSFGTMRKLTQEYLAVEKKLVKYSNRRILDTMRKLTETRGELPGCPEG